MAPEIAQKGREDGCFTDDPSLNLEYAWQIGMHPSRCRTGNDCGVNAQAASGKLIFLTSRQFKVGTGLRGAMRRSLLRQPLFYGRSEGSGCLCKA
jgi:hypothetical protein